MRALFVSILLSVPITAWPDSDVGTILVVKGKSKTESNGKLSVLEQGSTIKAGSVIKTQKNSYLRVIFIDETQMDLGPDTEVKVEKFPKGGPGLLSLLVGHARVRYIEKTTKKIRQKMAIRTPTALAEVKGTDFEIIYNDKNTVTSIVTFDGAVSFSKNPEGGESSQAYTVTPGNFSSINSDADMPSVPTRISPEQFDYLARSRPADSVSIPALVSNKESGSIVPPGTDPRSLAGQPEGVAALGPPPEGFYDADTGQYAPRAGGFIDHKSGLYIPPPADSAFDPVTGTYAVPTTLGEINPATGEYVPPPAYELDPVKGFIPKNPDSAQKTLPPPPLVFSPNVVSVFPAPTLSMPECSQCTDNNISPAGSVTAVSSTTTVRFNLSYP